MTEGRSISDRETIQLRRPNALPLAVSVNASPLYTDAGVQYGIILTLHDVSNLRQLEQDIQRAQHLEMLKTLAAGLAHEVKNPLGGIRGAAQLLSMELDQRNDLLEYTHVMIKETDRSEINLTKTINDIVLLQAQTEQGKKIQFNLQLDPSIPPIKGDKTLLTRLFLNLIKNATEAIAHNGTITVSTRIDSEHHLTRLGKIPVPFVVVKIIDNGPGISTNIIQKIFTPFYTTKSNGSGLGLAISQKIVTDHDGLLRIDSTQNQGTCCSVYLPLILIWSYKMSLKRVLVVDDEESIRWVLSKALTRQGLHVDVADCGTSARELLKKRGSQRPPFPFCNYDDSRIVDAKCR